jgi:predicted acylesterase/phospholipase RssA
MLHTRSRRTNRFLRSFIIFAALVGLGACAHKRPQAALDCELPAYKILPTSLHQEGPPQAGPPTFSAVLSAALQRRRSITEAPARRQVLMLSGGSQHGAFGAGFFRGLPIVPEYDVVTAVSTGALMSTPIFLANQNVPQDRQYPAYIKPDPKLGTPRHSNLEDLALAYSVSKEADLLRVRPFGFGSAVVSGSIASFAPLRRMLEGLISEETLKSVAKEAREKDRKLFVGVTNLDDGYGYAIDLTELAAGAERAGTMQAARQCYIDALLASSSVPPGVAPVALRLKGQESIDLFIDGGARYGIFFDQLGEVVTSGEPADVTVVVNGSLYGDRWKDKDNRPVKKWSVANVGFRAIDLLENQVYRLSVGDQEKWATRPGSVLRLAFISNEDLHTMLEDPDEWEFVKGQSCAAARESDRKQFAPVEFHPTYMRCLIDYGEARGSSDPWNKVIVGNKK